MRDRHYTLTKTAEQDFRQAKRWSLSRWGKPLTKQYFTELHIGAEYIAANLRRSKYSQSKSIYNSKRIKRYF